MLARAPELAAAPALRRVDDPAPAADERARPAAEAVAGEGTLVAPPAGGPTEPVVAAAVGPAASRPEPSPAALPPALAPAPRAAPAAPPAAPAAPAARTVKISVPVDVAVHGRFLFDVSADERDAWARSIGIGSARLGIEARLPGLKTVVEADLASDPMVEDAYVRIDGPRATRLTAGRFKAPFSERRLESDWALPLVDRGLVDHYLVKQNGLAGRRLGIAGTLRPWGGRLDATAGVFAGDPDALGVKSEAGEDYAARIAVAASDALRLGVSGYLAGTGASAAALPSRQAGGAFAALELGALEATLEAFAGHLAEGPFTAGTVLVGRTFHAGRTRALRITPVAGAEGLRLRGESRGVGFGAIGGAVLSWREGLKVKFQGEWSRRAGEVGPATAITAQVGTRF